MFTAIRIVHRMYNYRIRYLPVAGKSHLSLPGDAFSFIGAFRFLRAKQQR